MRKRTASISLFVRKVKRLGENFAAGFLPTGRLAHVLKRLQSGRIMKEKLLVIIVQLTCKTKYSHEMFSISMLLHFFCLFCFCSLLRNTAACLQGKPGKLITYLLFHQSTTKQKHVKMTPRTVTSEQSTYIYLYNQNGCHGFSPHPSGFIPFI